MSAIVLRCPACGTTQTHLGECDACSEGDVRYFCTNHSTGLWLSESRCTTCGAKFGDAPTVRPAPTVRAAPTRPRVTPPIDSTSAIPVRELPAPTVGPPRRRVAETEDPDAEPSLADVLVDMIEEGRRARAAEEPRWREPIAAAPHKPVIAGCLGRLMLLVFLLIAFALAGLSSLFGVTVVMRDATTFASPQITRYRSAKYVEGAPGADPRAFPAAHTGLSEQLQN